MEKKYEEKLIELAEELENALKQDGVDPITDAEKDVYGKTRQLIGYILALKGLTPTTNK